MNPPDSNTVQLRQRGVITLPKVLRDRYGLKQGDALHLVDLDGTFVLTPLMPMIPELAREIERLRNEAGLSTEELLAGLRRERERYAREQYGERYLEEAAGAREAGSAPRG